MVNEIGEIRERSELKENVNKSKDMNVQIRREWTISCAAEWTENGGVALFKVPWSGS